MLGTDAWLDGSCLSKRPINKEQKGKRTFYNISTLTHVKEIEKNPHLFDIKDKEVFNGADGGQHGAVERADPADSLTVDDLENILRNSKLLLTPPLSQATVTVLYYQPEEDGATQGHCYR